MFAVTRPTNPETPNSVVFNRNGFFFHLSICLEFLYVRVEEQYFEPQ